jgi:hypothetical protein
VTGYLISVFERAIVALHAERVILPSDQYLLSGTTWGSHWILESRLSRIGGDAAEERSQRPWWGSSAVQPGETLHEGSTANISFLYSCTVREEGGEQRTIDDPRGKFTYEKLLDGSALSGLARTFAMKWSLKGDGEILLVILA